MSKKAGLMVVLSSVNVFVKLLRTGDPILFGKTYFLYNSHPIPAHTRKGVI